MNIRDLKITIGAVWHGVWQAGRIEHNRRLYDFELVCFSSGTGRVIIEDEVYEFYPGSVLIIPPQVLHCTMAESAVERWCIHFDWFGDCRFHQELPEKESFFVYDAPDGGSFIPQFASKTPSDLKVMFPHFCRSVPPEVFSKIREFFSKINQEPISAMGSFMLALDAILSSKSHQAAGTSILLRAKGIIDREFSVPELSPRGVASKCGISVNYLNRLFRGTFGVPTGEFIISRRLELAETLLANGDLSVKETAIRCGFNDHNYFSRVFKAKKGVTPGNLRRKKT